MQSSLPCSLRTCPQSEVVHSVKAKQRPPHGAGLWLGSAVASGRALSAGPRTWTNTSLCPSLRAAPVVAAMTRAEKQTTLSGVFGDCLGCISGNSWLVKPGITFRDGPAGSGDRNTSDVVNWSSGSSSATQTVVTPLDAGRNLVTVTDNAPFSAISKRFTRLQVTLP